MEIKRLVLVVIGFFASLWALTIPNSQKIPVKPGEPVPINVSMIQLIATPERYYGKLVSAVGYLAIENENERLYVTEEDYRRNIPDNGVWVDVSKQMLRDIEKIDMHYVHVLGLFKEKGLQPHFFGAGNGGITEIRECLPWPELTQERPRRLKDMRQKNSR